MSHKHNLLAIVEKDNKKYMVFVQKNICKDTKLPIMGLSGGVYNSNSLLSLARKVYRDFNGLILLSEDDLSSFKVNEDFEHKLNDNDMELDEATLKLQKLWSEKLDPKVEYKKINKFQYYNNIVYIIEDLNKGLYFNEHAFVSLQKIMAMWDIGQGYNMGFILLYPIEDYIKSYNDIKNRNNKQIIIRYKGQDISKLDEDSSALLAEERFKQIMEHVNNNNYDVIEKLSQEEFKEELFKEGASRLCHTYTNIDNCQLNPNCEWDNTKNICYSSSQGVPSIPSPPPSPPVQHTYVQPSLKEFKEELYEKTPPYYCPTYTSKEECENHANCEWDNTKRECNRKSSAQTQSTQSTGGSKKRRKNKKKGKK
jgi:hypothetical protein